MNCHALALAGFVFVGLSVGAMLAVPLLVMELDGRERRRAAERGGWNA